MFCQNCGKEAEGDAKFCNHCGKPLSAQQIFPQPATGQKEINVVGAALLSIFPGAGLVYLGKIAKGICILVLADIFALFNNPLTGLACLIVWGYGIIDSNITADKMNKGKIPYFSPKIWDAVGFMIGGFIIMVIFNLFMFHWVIPSSP